MANIYGSSGNDNLTGTNVTESIFGLAGNDTLTAVGLNDSLEGGAGVDRLVGDATGSTWASYQSASSAVTVSLTGELVGDKANDAYGDVFSTISKFVGSEFADTFILGESAVTIDGGSGYDAVSYVKSTESLNLSISKDAIIHGRGDDIFTNVEKIIATNNNDYFYVRGGVDIDAAEGEDILHFAESASGVNVTIDANNTVTVDGSQYSNFEIYQGTSKADKFLGNAQDNQFFESPGNDTIDGGAGTDTITYFLSLGGVTVNLQDSYGLRSDQTKTTLMNIENVRMLPFENIWFDSNPNDLLIGNDSNNKLEAGRGNDTLVGGGGADTLDGGAGNDFVSYASSTSAITLNFATGKHGGDAAGDVLIGIENVIGSKFDDKFIINDLSMTVNGTAGFDTLSFAEINQAIKINLNPANPADLIYFNIANLEGTKYADQLTGDARDNVLTGGAGADTLDGGEGYDSVSYLSSAAGVQVNLSTHAGAKADAAGDVYIGIESATGSNFNDALLGSGGANFLVGADGNDTIYGGAGDDTVYGGLYSGSASSNLDQADILYAGPGNDVIYTSEHDIGSIAYGQAGKDQFHVYSATAYGGEDNDSFYTYAAGAKLYGENGDDTFSLNAAVMADGGAGNDTYFVNSANVNILEGVNGGTDTVNTKLGAITLSNNVENLTYLGTSEFTGTGNATNNFIQGGVKADILKGGAGNDILVGGAGADNLDGGDGLDTASYLSSAAAVQVNMVAKNGTVGDAKGDVLNNIENITGSNFNDQLIGDTQNNLLQGADGNDTIYGGAGNDTIMGGVSDTGPFASTAPSNQEDIIYAGPGDDVVTTNTLDVGSIVYGQDGADNITVFSGTVYGGNHNDTLTGKTAQAIVYGEAGNDNIVMYGGTAYGGSNNDTLTAKVMGGSLYGGDGDDTFIMDTSINTYTYTNLVGGEGSDIYKVGSNQRFVSIEDYGNVGTDKVYLSSVATPADLEYGRYGDMLYIHDSNSTIFIELPNWYSSTNQNTIEAFIVGNGETVVIGHEIVG